MNRRSSLDPFEEARAIVRLRHSRARVLRHPMKRAGLAADRAFRKLGPVRLPPLKLLQIRWREIVGEQLHRYCRPEKLTAGASGRILALRVIPQAALIVQHQSETIRQRVSVAAGGDIAAIRLVQGPLPVSGSGQTARLPPRPLSQDEKALIEARSVLIENPRLRAAIVALGSAVLSADS